MGSKALSISVVYALADRQEIVRLSVDEETTVARAVELSGLQQTFPELASRPSCAIFGRVVDASYIVGNGDRIEILRPLLIDPKEHRRQLAAKNKTKG